MYKMHKSTRCNFVQADGLTIHVATCYRKSVPRDKPDRREGKDLRDVKRLINRLIGWLKAAGFTAEQITECIEYITK